MGKLGDFILDEKTMPILEYISNRMPGGFFIYRAYGDQELIFCNEAMARIFGCETVEEFQKLTHNSFKGIVHPDDYEDVEQSIRNQIKHSVYDLDYVEYRIIRKDGSVRWVEDYGHFSKTNAFGDVFYVFIEDATDRMRKRMRELEEVNAELRNAYDKATQYKKAILYDAATFFEVNLTKDEFITSASQIVDGRVMDLFDFAGVQRFQKYSEYIAYWRNNVAEEEKKSYDSFFNFDSLISNYEVGELEQTFECWITDIYGRKRLAKYILLFGRNEITGDVVALSLAKDITKQFENQRILETALQQANAANIARNTFLANMSHDIRTPLNSIIGFTKLIRSNKDNLTPEKLDDYMRKIESSGEQLLSIVTESMEITRIDSGKASLVETPCNLLDILSAIERKFVPEASGKKLSFLVDKGDISHFNIIMDKVRIQEVLSQILDNAVKYTPQGGKILLSCREICDKPLSRYAKYCFTVEDNGIGMSEEFQKHLYEPFERESNTTSSGVFGTGLGLAVVKNIVDMMNGTIDVKSAPGKGSIFTVTVTAAIQKQPLAQGSTAYTQPDIDKLKGKKVLLVEDNEINKEIAQELLEMTDFVVDTAENGLQAVNKIQSQPADAYDIVLMDIQMPVMDGYEATIKIRHLDDKEKAEIPIIAVSANAFAEDLERSRMVGMNAHCSKPIDIDYLKDLIRHILLQES